MKSLSNKEADLVREFVFQIQHGDKDHRDWLVEAGELFIKGEPVKPVRGGKPPPLPPIMPTSGFIADD
jgi:hypothetical protein